MLEGSVHKIRAVFFPLLEEFDWDGLYKARRVVHDQTSMVRACRHLSTYLCLCVQFRH